LSKGTSGTTKETVAVVDDDAAVVEDDGDCIRRDRMTIPSPAGLWLQIVRTNCK
jgi:hypothetical protein